MIKQVQQVMSTMEAPSRARELLADVGKVSQVGKCSGILPSESTPSPAQPGDIWKMPCRDSATPLHPKLSHPGQAPGSPLPEESAVGCNHSTHRPVCYISKALHDVFLEVISFGLRPSNRIWWYLFIFPSVFSS